MKYVFFIVFLLLFIPFDIQAAEDRQPKTITGKVRNPDTTIAKNVPVSVTCKNTTISAQTTINGNYTVKFGDLECEQFDTAFVVVKTDTSEGSTSKVVTFALTITMSDITLSPVVTGDPEISPEVSPTIIEPSIVTPTQEAPAAVPEFGTVSAIMAGSLSLFTYYRFKSKS